MELSTYDSKLGERNRLGENIALGARAVKLFFLIRGRNAWHSTWVQHYSPGAMTTDLQSALNNAEKRRTQGSAFYIDEWPALAIDTEAGVFLITQINTKTPLAHYSVEPPPDARVLPGTKPGLCRKRQLCSGTTIKAIRASFEQWSRHWTQTPWSENSVLCFWLDACHRSKLAAADGPFHRRTSEAPGSRDFLLGWSVKPDTALDASHIRRLAAQFAE